MNLISISLTTKIDMLMPSTITQISFDVHTEGSDGRMTWQIKQGSMSVNGNLYEAHAKRPGGMIYVPFSMYLLDDRIIVRDGNLSRAFNYGGKVERDRTKRLIDAWFK